MVTQHECNKSIKNRSFAWVKTDSDSVGFQHMLACQLFLRGVIADAVIAVLEPGPCCNMAQGPRALAPIVAQFFGTIVEPAFVQRDDCRSVLELGKAFDALGPQTLVVCLTFPPS